MTQRTLPQESPDPHTPDALLRGYARGETPAHALRAVESHLDHCPLCRSRLSGHTDPRILDHGWERLDVAIDAPVPGTGERLLVRFGVPDHVARLIAATPALRASWVGAAALTLLLAALIARLAEPAGTPLLFLGLAPLLPVAGVAVSYGRRWDPAHEMGLVTPMRALRLVLLRTAVVLATCIALTGAASLAVPGLGLATFGWLLPGCALTAVSLALAARMDSTTAAGATAAGWLAVLIATHDSHAVFSATGQTASAAVLAVASVAVLLSRTAFDRPAYRQGTAR
ncbi:zf-HC2 domain-containing protein [Streptomyces cyaneochromogenes]|uniref:Zf-HC2 domain-containing protein n=1 Tax=Streptomyces cyaneochromogenes TaxID=2496836 RepID=A0A3Q9EUR1_9ACTN|nr:zf-HC2 domain-containing protein [Streptomyces cyaneochromogenes]AZQ36453.1 zf-HC2 domain-containing protein [Streptomyces cyaneochromogenes]